MASDTGKRVWITGASQGLGRALAWHYCAAGWRVVVSARNATALQQLQNEAQQRQLAGTIELLPLDITRRTDVHKAVARLLAAGPLQRAILNAGTHRHQPLREQALDADDVRQLLELNVMGTVHCIEALLPHWSPATTSAAGTTPLPATPPQLALVASLAGYRGLPSACGYGASKAALINLAESLRAELDPQRVDVRLINPGFVKTPLTDKNPFPMPDIISARQAADYIDKGLQRPHGFEVRFPPRFATGFGLLRILPYRLYFALIRRITGTAADPNQDTAKANPPNQDQDPS